MHIDETSTPQTGPILETQCAIDVCKCQTTHGSTGNISGLAGMTAHHELIGVRLPSDSTISKSYTADCKADSSTCELSTCTVRNVHDGTDGIRDADGSRSCDLEKMDSMASCACSTCTFKRLFLETIHQEKCDTVDELEETGADRDQVPLDLEYQGNHQLQLPNCSDRRDVDLQCYSQRALALSQAPRLSPADHGPLSSNGTFMGLEVEGIEPDIEDLHTLHSSSCNLQLRCTTMYDVPPFPSREQLDVWIGQDIGEEYHQKVRNYKRKYIEEVTGISWALSSNPDAGLYAIDVDNTICSCNCTSSTSRSVHVACTDEAAGLAIGASNIDSPSRTATSTDTGTGGTMFSEGALASASTVTSASSGCNCTSRSKSVSHTILDLDSPTAVRTCTCTRVITECQLTALLIPLDYRVRNYDALLHPIASNIWDSIPFSHIDIHQYLQSMSCTCTGTRDLKFDSHMSKASIATHAYYDHDLDETYREFEYCSTANPSNIANIDGLTNSKSSTETYAYVDPRLLVQIQEQGTSIHSHGEFEIELQMQTGICMRRPISRSRDNGFIASTSAIGSGDHEHVHDNDSTEIEIPELELEPIGHSVASSTTSSGNESHIPGSSADLVHSDIDPDLDLAACATDRDELEEVEFEISAMHPSTCTALEYGLSRALFLQKNPRVSSTGPDESILEHDRELQLDSESRTAPELKELDMDPEETGTNVQTCADHSIFQPYEQYPQQRPRTRAQARIEIARIVQEFTDAYF